MALKAILAKLDEVDEKYRDLYTQRGDKFEFTGVEGLKTQADIDRQLAANQKVRTDLTKAQTDLKAANDKLALWEEMEPEDVKTKLEKLSTLEAGNQVPELAKNFEQTVNSRVQTVLEGKVKAETAKLNRNIDELKAKLGTSEGLNQQYVAANNERTVHDAVRASATSAKVLPEAVPDLLIVAGRELKLVDGKVVTEDGRDPTAWLEDRKQKTPYLWAVSTGAGGRGDGPGGQGGDGSNPFRADNWSLSNISQLVKTQPAQAAKLAEQAGVRKDASGNFLWHEKPAEKKAA